MTDAPFDLIIHGGTVCCPSTLGARVQIDLGIRAGKFAAFGNLRAAKAQERIDATGLTILPGVIDSQVHMREPGLEHKEDLAHGALGAVLGGVTAVFEMPNTKPNTDTPAALADKLQRASGRMRCDYAFYLGATGDNAEQLAAWENLPGAAGVKIFMGSSTGSLLVEDDATLLRVLGAGRRRVAVHAEDEFRLRDRRNIIDRADPALHPVWRDVGTALLATQRLVAAARACARRVHVLHITSADEMEFLRDHKDLVTVEVLVNHLTLAAPECYERLGTLAQQNPPVRDEHHRAALWRAVNDGTVDVLATDHAPHTLAEKAKPYPESPAGMPGVQTMVPVMLDHVAAGRLTLERFVELTSAGPQRVFGIAGKGRIALGYDADLTLVDLAAQREIRNSAIASISGWTPFDGMRVTGWPIMTIIRGHVVMRDDQAIGEPLGQAISFVETMTAAR